MHKVMAAAAEGDEAVQVMTPPEGCGIEVMNDREESAAAAGGRAAVAVALQHLFPHL